MAINSHDILNPLIVIARQLPWIGLVVLSLSLLAGLVLLCLKLWRYRQLLKQKNVYVELTPPATTDKIPLANQQLFTVMHSMSDSSSILKRLIRPPLVLSLEIVSSRGQGIRYIIRTPRDRVKSLESALTSYLPEVKVGRVADYMPTDYSAATVMSFRQNAHFAYPLRSHEMLEQQDPLAYLTGAMAKLKSGELMAMQLIIKPTYIKQADELARMVARNEDIEMYLKRPKVGGLELLTKLINKMLFSLTDTVTYAYHGQSSNSYSQPQKENFQKSQSEMRLRPARILSPFEQRLFEDVHQKLSQPLFRTDIRALVMASSIQERKRRIADTKAALASFGVPKYQSLKAKGRKLTRTYRLYEFNKRLPSVFNRHSNLFSASELASLYHFPNRQSTKTDNIIKSLSRTLPAPVSLKNGQKLDVLLGVNRHHGSETAIGLTEAERERHIYIIGGTGNGKTTMMLYAITQDIKAGKGLAVIDPHGDLAEAVLRHIPENRIKDVVYMNPDDLTHPIGVNLLELPDGLTGDELLREKDLVTESTISVMRKIFSEDDTGGHRIEYVLRNTIQTALTLENPTLFTIFELLNDNKFRKEATAKLEDKDLKNFWRNELGKAGEFQRVKMAAGITAKIGRFLFSASAKRVLEQPKSTINFEDIMDSGKILICNFSKGLIGEDTSTLFGTTVLAKLQMASLRRARLNQADRRPFYLYVDEFQNFATMSFVQMLSEARKYKLFLTMAEQSTTQQQYQRLVEVILANVGTVICFRSGSPADERLILPLFKPFIDEGEIANLPSFNFYMRIAALEAQEPLSGVTKLLGDEGNTEVANRVKGLSRRMYAIEYLEVQENKGSKAETPKVNKSEEKSTASLVSAKRTV